MSVSQKRDYLIALLFFILISSLWISQFTLSYFQNPDAYDYAQIGRELSKCNGFSTLQIFPRHIPFLQTKGFLSAPHWPELLRAPLAPVADAFAMIIFSNPVVASVVQSGMSFLISIPVFFLLARRLTNFITAILATLFYAGDWLSLQASYSGMSESQSTLLVLLLLFMAFNGDLNRIKWAVMGVLSGLCYLSRTQFIFVLPLGMLYAWVSTSRDKWKAPLIVAIGWLIVISPWMVRNTMVTGNPMFSFLTTRALLWETSEKFDPELHLHSPVDAGEILKIHGPEIFRKYKDNLNSIWSLVFWTTRFITPLPLFFFFIVSFFYRRNELEPQFRLFQWTCLVLILVNFFVVSFVENEVRFYTAFRPIIVLIGTATIMKIVSNVKTKSYRIGATLLVGLVAVAFLNFSLRVLHKDANSLETSIMEHRIDDIYALRNFTEPDSVIASNTSFAVSLYAERRSLRLPTNPLELLEINDKYLRVQYIFLTQDLQRYQPYQEFTKSNLFLDHYESIKTFQNGGILFKTKRDSH
jgi:hypothetical protein